MLTLPRACITVGRSRNVAQLEGDVGAMADSPVLLRVEMLQREMLVIQEEQRAHQGARNESPASTMAYATRRLRMSVIKAELESLQEKVEPLS